LIQIREEKEEANLQDVNGHVHNPSDVPRRYILPAAAPTAAAAVATHTATAVRPCRWSQCFFQDLEIREVNYFK